MSSANNNRKTRSAAKLKEEVKKINVKPLMPLKRLNSNKDNTVTVSLTGESPTEKAKPGSIHDLLEQLNVSPDSKESRAGKLAADRWREKTVRQIYDEFCAETSFSALTRINKATHWYKRIIWLVACLCMLSWLSIQCVWLFQKYFSYPVEVKIEVKAVSDIEFPSITICNINPLKACELRGPFEEIRDLFELDDKDTLYEDFIKDKLYEWASENETHDTSDEDFWDNYLQNNTYNRWDALENDTDMAEEFYHEMSDAHTAMFAYSSVATKLKTDVLRKHGHMKEDLILSCTWQSLACSPANFTYLRNNMYGNCYTFNAHDNGHEALSTNYAGPLMGLVLELNIEQSEYIAAISPEAGVKLVIHKRGTYPIPEDDGVSLPPGFKTSIGLSKRKITRLPPPHADCGNGGVDVNNYYMEEFDTEYTKSTCLKSCLQGSIIDECGCASSFFYVPSDVPVCENNGSSCFDSTACSVIDTCNGRCPTPCSDTRYDLTMSMTQWPSDVYEKHLTEKISKSTYEFMDKNKRDNSKSTLVKVEVYYNELMIETVEQQKAYESQNLISDIGGQLGLWLGLSAITVGELIEFFASLSRVIAAKVCGRRQGGRGLVPEAGRVSPMPT